MKTNSLFLCLIIASTLFNRLAAAATSDAGLLFTTPAKSIPWDEVGAAAGAQYSGEGLKVTPTERGARLQCVFQRTDGEATSDGLWLISTVTNQPNDRFCVVAAAVGGRPLSRRGEISVAGQSVKFRRPGLVEEYTVSMDGVRQDFVVLEKPALNSKPSTINSTCELRVDLSVTGARVEQTAQGAQLILNSGRKIAYSRLRVEDTNGKELPARIEVPSSSPLQTAVTAMTVVVDDSNAVYPVRIDPTFSDANWISMGGIPGADRQVYAAVVDDSGNLYIGGEFRLVGDVVAVGIAKWNGSRWSAVGSGVGGYSPIVHALAVSGSNVYAGGRFTSAGGVPASYIAKWDGNSWSALSSGMNYWVNALAVSGSNLYAGGEFITAGDLYATNIAKWNGSAWSAVGAGIDGPVYELAADGEDLYVGGSFTAAGGVLVNSIAKWNGSSWLALGSGVERADGYRGSVSALVLVGSDLYAGGSFVTAGGMSATNIAKWDGNSWTALSSGLMGTPPGIVFSSYVSALAVLGGELYVGGLFTTAGGVPANCIAKWDGISWSALGSGMSITVQALAAWGNELYAGGEFTTAGGSVANRIAQWDGVNWNALGSGLAPPAPLSPSDSPSAYVRTLATSGSNLYAGGRFRTSGEVSATNLAKWDGSNWTPVGSGVIAGPPGGGSAVYSLSVSGSNLYAGGSFTRVAGVSANQIAKWNGSTWSPLGSGMNGAVLALAVMGNDLYAGGNFTFAGGVSAKCVARWNGSNWSALASGLDRGNSFTNVAALAVLGGDLYVAGNFTTAGGIAATNIAKWDGSSWSSLGGGIYTPFNQGQLSALAVSGADLYAGGRFTRAGGSAANNIAKWNGTSWSALGSGINNDVYALAVSGGELYAGSSSTIAKWNGSTWSALGSGMGAAAFATFSGVYALTASGNDLYAGGEFTKAGGKVSAYIARAVLGDAPGYNQLTGLPLSGGTMQFSYVGYPATNYALDRTFNLEPPISWAGQRTNTMNVSGVLMFTNTPVAGTNNFWRVRAVP